MSVGTFVMWRPRCPCCIGQVCVDDRRGDAGARTVIRPASYASRVTARACAVWSLLPGYDDNRELFNFDDEG